MQSHRSLRTATAIGAAAATAVLLPARAGAQIDVTPPLPNVLILLDTSGSMERMPNSALPTFAVNTTSTTVKNRWIMALEVLGGSIQNYSLLRQDRSSADFRNEFGLGGRDPYDSTYYLPHFRPLANGCALGSPSLSQTKTWPTDWKTWGISSFGFRRFAGSSLGAIGSCSANDFATDGLGLLDTYRDQARFGLMTFDGDPQRQTGWNGSAHVPIEGMQGQWSYFPNWNKPASATPTHGWPAGCSLDPTSLSDHAFELGARNPSAPPWEGPLVGFAANDSTSALREVNDRIRYAVFGARPYGATPIAPMLADAQHYYLEDDDGPKADPVGDCRGNFIILVTDGFPNSDLRPSCQSSPDPKASATWPSCNVTTGGGGCCPTKRAQDIAYDLRNPSGGKRPVTTYVIGFALSDDNGNAVSCEGVDPSGTTCASMAANDPKKPCCTLHEIAYNGGSDRAFFASDAETLRAKLKEAMDQVTGKTTSSRTVAAFGSTSSGGQYEFLSGFRVNPFAAWSGKLERVRWECTAGAGGSKAQPQPIDASKGDDYAVALNKQTTRKFWTALPTTSASGTTRAGDTLRPGLSADDGLGTVGADVVTGSGTSFVGAISAAQMGLTASSCPDTSSAEECKQKYLNYALALAQPKPTWSSRQGNALGDIYHANPVQVGPPDEFLRDDSYLQFRLDAGARTPFVLAATNDGLLHAFKADVKSDTEDAELWAFLPPAVLPNVGKQYGSRALLLDASPVVKNVAFGAQTGGGRARNDVARWATIAVSGLTVGTGATGGRGYFALDVTDPKNPKFLWQLTKDAAGRDLFGTAPGQPAIATLYFREGSDGKLAEVPVAILPGGEGRAHKTGTCNRWKSVTTASDPLVTPRSKVRCWIGAGASFTIVRLLDGKVIRTFRNDPAGNGTADHPADATAPILPDAIVKGSGFGDGFAGIDSPITGAVALYPAATGTVTTRAFVGDYDGTLWKADLSDPDPRAWRFEIFHDAYFPNDPANRDATKWGPIAVPPVLSVDRFGDVVVNYATGDQNNFSEVNLNHVYSVTERTETVSGAKVLAPKVNWHLKFPAGITPTGPMSLFGEALYLSTFTPGVGAASACVKGQGTIWGVHYVNASSIANDDGSRAPAPALKKEGLGDDTASATACPGPYPNTDSDAKDFFRCNVLAQGTIVFGTSVTQRPSCVDTAASPIGLDPYFGGAYSPVTNIAVGDFELVAQTGAGGAKNVVGASLNTMARKLPTPPPSTRVDSWATLVE